MATTVQNMANLWQKPLFRPSIGGFLRDYVNAIYILARRRYVNTMNITQDLDSELAVLRNTARRMDALFYIPRTRISVGLDNLFGLIPVVGDLLALGPALWIVWRARKLGATPGTLAYMTVNVTLDFAIGAIPIVGDIFDMLYNANIRNYRALERNLNVKAAAARTIYDPATLGRTTKKPPQYGTALIA